MADQQQNSSIKIEQTTADKVKDAIMTQLGVDADQVTNAAYLIDDLGADSLDIVEVVMEIEEKLDITIPDEDVEYLKTVRNYMECAQSKLDGVEFKPSGISGGKLRDLRGGESR